MMLIVSTDTNTWKFIKMLLKEKGKLSLFEYEFTESQMLV